MVAGNASKRCFRVEQERGRYIIFIRVMLVNRSWGRTTVSAAYIYSAITKQLGMGNSEFFHIRCTVTGYGQTYAAQCCDQSYTSQCQALPHHFIEHQRK